MSRKKDDGARRVRKIGEREEMIEIEFTPAQIAEKRVEVMVLLDEEERIDAKKDELAKNFASQLKTNKLQINELRRQITSGKTRQTLIVEEYLTQANEIVKIRKDTGEQIGARTATPRELQEEMFGDKPEEGAPQNDAPSEDFLDPGEMLPPGSA